MYRKILIQNTNSITSWDESKAYTATIYPFSGLWIAPLGNLMFVVDKVANVVSTLSSTKEMDTNIFKDYEEPKVEKIVPGKKAEYVGISENMVLKMLAVIQKPDLAKELTNV